MAVPADIIIKTMRGALITIYGINNIGKSTHARILCERLERAGHKTVYIKFPVYDIEPTGPFLNKILRGAGEQKISEDELQLWFVMNRYQVQPQLKKWLDEGCIVVAEDYIGTGIAWGVTKGLDQNWLESANQFLLKEDFAIVIRGERNTKAQESGHIHEENAALMKKSDSVHDQLADEYGWRKIALQKKVTDTADLIFNAVDDFLKNR